MRTIQTTYRYRIEPTAEQDHDLRSFAGARRWVWNWALRRKQDHYRETGTGLSYHDLAAALTVLKQQPETAWLRTVDSQLLQQVLRDLDRAFVNFFEQRARDPTRKRRKTDPLRFRIPQRVTIAGEFVRVPKIGLIRVRLHRPIEGTMKSATFKQEPDGHWYVCLVVEQQRPPRSDRPVESHVGIDMGLKEFAVLSTEERVANPRFGRIADRKLRRLHRRLSRGQKGSRNRTKARQRLACQYQKVRHQRGDFLHQRSARLVRDNDLISIEDLNTRGLAKTKLARSVLDAGWGSFRRMLIYKADRHATSVQLIGRFYPSSRLCPVCETINHHLTVADRVWICVCGTVHDRDLNAARNIDREGLRLFELSVAVGHPETQNACGPHVRPATAGSAG